MPLEQIESVCAEIGVMLMPMDREIKNVNGFAFVTQM